MAIVDRQCFFVFFFLSLTFEALSLPATQHEDVNDRKQEPAGRNIDLENMCDLRQSLSVFCMCDSEKLQDALDARCEVFNMTDQNDLIWESFSSQGRITEIELLVEGTKGQMHFVPVNALRYLKALKKLEIRGAAIDALGSHAFPELKQLAYLKLTRNKIRHIRSYAFQGLAFVTELDLGNNALTDLERGAFAGLDSLQALYLDSNNISNIEDSVFLSLPALTQLVLYNNAIAMLTADTLLGLRQLRKLDMRHNQLVILGDLTFSSVPQLRRLDLRFNQLKVIRNRAFDGLMHMESLDLANNALTVVGPQAVHRIWPNLLSVNASLTLDGNPWRCECPLRWMSSLASQSQSDEIRQALKELTCISKGEGSTIQLVRTVENLECSPADESSAEEVDKAEPVAPSATAFRSVNLTLISTAIFFCLLRQ